ncbi:MAG: WXG100 family type VII secretion target [Clostridiales bacterium]|nr:WXG100 family type VII secretion target [Clostridiales bacterium]
MAQIRVTMSQLKAQAEQLEALNEQFKSQINDLEATEQQLGTMWEGEAKNAFHNAFSSDKAQMDNFYGAIKMYVQALLADAAKYSQAEAASYNLAAERTYK